MRVRRTERRVPVRQRGLRRSQRRRRVGEADLEFGPCSSSSQRLALHPGSGVTGRLAAAPDQTLALYQPLPDQQGVLSDLMKKSSQHHLSLGLTTHL